MNRALRNLVWDRAQGRCEYCCMPQEYDEATFEIDHVRAKKHGGKTVAENLCLACFYCNRFRGSNLSGIDPKSGKPAFLFNPRLHQWNRHFKWKAARLLGRTSRGRATIATLRINDTLAIKLRKELIDEGVFPP